MNDLHVVRLKGRKVAKTAVDLFLFTSAPPESGTGSANGSATFLFLAIYLPSSFFFLLPS